MKKVDKLLENYLRELGFDNFPKGWDKKSVKKFADTISKKSGHDIDSKEWFYACVDSIKGAVDDPEALCATIKDETLGKTGWRGEERED